MAHGFIPTFAVSIIERFVRDFAKKI
jgi:hypothetical protein